jgi:hypothetical protein
VASTTCSCSARASGVGLAALERSLEPDSAWYAESVRATSSLRSAARPRASVRSGRSVPAESRASGLAAFAWIARRTAAIVGTGETAGETMAASRSATDAAATFTCGPPFSAREATPMPPVLAPAATHNEPWNRFPSAAGCKNSADGGGRARRRRRQTTKAVTRSKSSPPSTPPTIAPMGTDGRLLALVLAPCTLPEPPFTPEPALEPPGVKLFDEELTLGEGAGGAYGAV